MIYKQRKVNGRKIDEHRLLMENIIGRKLKSHEYVHHIDGDKLNNDIENLEIVTPAIHAIRHNRWKHPKEKICKICGVKYEPSPTKRARSKTCSRECGLLLLSLKNRNPNAKYSMYREDACPSRKKDRKIVPQVAAEFISVYREVK